MSSLSISDLIRNVLTGLSETNSKSESTANDTGTEKRKGDSEFCYGEHVACFWYDDQESRYQWHLAIGSFQRRPLFMPQAPTKI